MFQNGLAGLPGKKKQLKLFFYNPSNCWNPEKRQYVAPDLHLVKHLFIEFDI